jgi:hypothetical protein
LTRIERRLWGPTLDRQYRSEDARYRRYLANYGDVASTYLSVAWLWLIVGNPLFVLVLVCEVLGEGDLFLAGLLCVLTVGAMALIRNLMAVREGRRWRAANGVPPPTTWRRKKV